METAGKCRQKKINLLNRQDVCDVYFKKMAARRDRPVETQICRVKEGREKGKRKRRNRRKEQADRKTASVMNR